LYYYFFQKNYIFFPSRDYKQAPEKNIEEIFISTLDGERLHAWHMATPTATKTALFFHGNAGNLTDRTLRLDVFKRLNLNALMIDYRGYGRSSGKIEKEADLYLDAQAAWNYLTQDKAVATKNIIIWGRSLGGTIAVDLAQGKQVAALVLESTFVSIKEMVPGYMRYLPIDLILRYRFLSVDKIKKVKSPVLIVHSKTDEIVPFEHGQRFYQDAPEPKQFLELKGGHNTDVVLSYDKYLKGLENFFIEYINN
jgi:fermentation-respiration switch protein FrsA (DUF1100 family)